MSATFFLAFCIIGCALLLYFLFQWNYGEKHRGLARRSNSHDSANLHKSQPIEFVPRRASSSTTQPRFKEVVPRSQQIEQTRDTNQQERLVYRRIAASFAHTKR